MRLTAIPAALVVLVLALVYVVDRLYELDLARFGVLPRSVDGLIGILTAPLLHGDREHLLNNAISMFALGWALMYFYPRIAGRVFTLGWLVTGVLVWLAARPDRHIGASGVVYTMAAFLFTSGMIRKQRTLMALSMLVVFMYGSMIWGLFPIVPRISWESHLFGALVGVAAAFAYRAVPPAVQDPVIVLDDPEDEEDLPDDGSNEAPRWSAGADTTPPRPKDGAVTTTWDPLR